MPVFQVLVIKEHVHRDSKQLDNRLCILYDADEETYYFYGSRNNVGEMKYADYSGSYTYAKRKEFRLFLEFILGGKDALLSTELHLFDIPMEEYDSLDWIYFMARLRPKTLLAAYDFNIEAVKYIKKYLNLLVNV
jgi:hypothetical protein